MQRNQGKASFYQDERLTGQNTSDEAASRRWLDSTEEREPHERSVASCGSVVGCAGMMWCVAWVVLLLIAFNPSN